MTISHVGATLSLYTLRVARMSDVAILSENSDCEEPLHMSAVEEGGYFALQLGDILRDELEQPGQWEIVRELGWGSNANVWLVKDL